MRVFPIDNDRFPFRSRLVDQLHSLSIGSQLQYLMAGKKPQIPNGKVVIITGASSGLGRQLAIQFSKHRIYLFLAARNKQRLQQTARLCESNCPISVDLFLGELSSQEVCHRLINQVEQNFGRIDYLVLNAGVNAHSSFEALEDLGIYEKLMKTNFYANVYLTKYALPLLKKFNSQVVVISSISGKLGLPDRSAYCASKFALSGFFESLRTEEDNISITIAYPTSLDTPMRKNDLLGQTVTSNDSKNKQQSAERAASKIIACLRDKQTDIYIPRKLWLGALIQPLFPTFMRNKVRQAAKL